jgi:hypothetical protein
VKLGTATDPDLINLLIAIETPDKGTTSVPGDPSVPAYPTIDYDASGQPSYPSVGDLYSVVEQLIAMFKSTMVASPNQIINGLFSDWYQLGGAITPANVAEAVDVIVDQGEGALGKQDAPLSAQDALDLDAIEYKHPYVNEDMLSHVERFSLLQGNTAQVTVWPINGSKATVQQQNLSAILGMLLQNLRNGWSAGGPDLSPMFLVRAAFAQVFRNGVLPLLEEPDPTQLASLYAAAQDAVAPMSGATWDDNVQYFFSYTDILGMRANGQATNLDSEQDVANALKRVVSKVQSGEMPPENLNAWSSPQVQSLANWKGN